MEIKFRAWDKEKEQWHKWKPFYQDLDDSIEMTIGAKDENLVYLQFTGLTDKNGKDIYEGDVVKYVYWNEGFNPVKKHYTNHTVEYMKVSGSDDMGTDMIGYNSEVSSGEVIGNIYQNPELKK